MYGDDGWCRGCGRPTGPQIGPLTLQRRGLGSAKGVWIPYWRYEALCMDREVAESVAARFGVETRPVLHPAGGADVFQLVIEPVGSSWFDPAEMERATIDHHGSPGRECPVCHTWRWFPLPSRLLPPLNDEARLGVGHVGASPEFFGDGLGSTQLHLFSRELAQVLVDASPRDFFIEEPTWQIDARRSAR